MCFRRIRGVKRSVFAVNAERNGAFSAKMRYSRKSGYVLVFNTYIIKIFEILGLGLVYYWMVPKNCEKRTIKSHACVPLRCSKCTISFVLVLFTNIIAQFSFKQAFMSKMLSNCVLLAQFLKFFSLCHTETKTHFLFLLNQLLIWLLIGWVLTSR